MGKADALENLMEGIKCEDYAFPIMGDLVTPLAMVYKISKFTHLRMKNQGVNVPLIIRYTEEMK